MVCVRSESVARKRSEAQAARAHLLPRRRNVELRDRRRTFTQRHGKVLLLPAPPPAADLTAIAAAAAADARTSTVRKLPPGLASQLVVEISMSRDGIFV